MVRADRDDPIYKEHEEEVDHGWCQGNGGRRAGRDSLSLVTGTISVKIPGYFRRWADGNTDLGAVVVCRLREHAARRERVAERAAGAVTIATNVASVGADVELSGNRRALLRARGAGATA